MPDIVVIGAGHAGCEAALAAARMGMETLLLTLNMDGVALMACNPVIGGSAKGHLVREVDALGGEMALAIDDTFLQSRMLNTGKGPAVHALRAQADKQAYQNRMRRALMTQPRLTLRQGEVASIETEEDRVTAVTTVTGSRIPCRAVVAATGVYLRGSIVIGDHRHDGGPQGLMNASEMSKSLENLGFELRRFKTGTPARIDQRTIDFDEMEIQRGDEPVTPFSFLTDRALENTYPCYLTWTNAETHRIIRDNLHRSPLYSGQIHGIGPRYCPSIEDKIVRFADKERHQIFLEPEGRNSLEWYVQGMSSSLPEDVQWAMYRTIPGLRRCELTRLAYAIEYDCIDSRELRPTLECRKIAGLYSRDKVCRRIHPGHGDDAVLRRNGVVLYLRDGLFAVLLHVSCSGETVLGRSLALLDLRLYHVHGSHRLLEVRLHDSGVFHCSCHCVPLCFCQGAVHHDVDPFFPVGQKLFRR